MKNCRPIVQPSVRHLVAVDEVKTRSVTVEVPVYSKERGLARPWPAEYYLAVYVAEKGLRDHRG